MLRVGIVGGTGYTGVELLRLEPGSDHTATGHELALALDGTTVYLSPGTPIYTDTVTFVVTPA